MTEYDIGYEAGKGEAFRDRQEMLRHIDSKNQQIGILKAKVSELEDRLAETQHMAELE